VSQDKPGAPTTCDGEAGADSRKGNDAKSVPEQSKFNLANMTLHDNEVDIANFG
jgi:hypothetical protein